MDLSRLQTALVNADAAGDTEAATALAQTIRGMQEPAPDKFRATAQADSNTDNLLASIGGAMYAPYLKAKQIAGAATPEDVAEYKQSMSGLWGTPMGKVGTVAGGLAVGAPLAVLPGANTLAGAALGGAALGAMQPTGEDESTLRNAAIGGAGGVAGQAIGGGIASYLAKRGADKATNLAAQKAQNAVRDSTVAEAQAAGYVFPPAQINPSTANRALEGFAGKLTTAQNASAKNQAVSNTLARREIGIPDTVPLTKEAIEQARIPAYQAYENMRGFGTLQATPEYAKALDDIATKYDLGHGGMKSLRNKQVEDLLEDAAKTEINTNNAVELLRNLREKGFANTAPLAKAEEKALGKTQLKVANAIEDLIDQNLEQAGQQELLQQFRAARVHLAKTYTVEKALNEATGNVRASKLAQDFLKGKPLSGGLETVGKAGAAFPKATAEITTSLPQLSPLDYMGGVLTAGATGNPMAAAAGLARPGVRAGLLSGPYQRAMVQPPSYDLGAMEKLLPGIAASPSTRAIERLLGSYGLLGIAPEQ